MSTEIFKTKSGAKLAELAAKSGASITDKSRGLCQEKCELRRYKQSEHYQEIEHYAKLYLKFIRIYIKFVQLCWSK